MDLQEVQLSHPAADPASATVVNEVRRVAPGVQLQGDRLRFEADLVARIEPFTRPGKVEIYRCPEGWLLYCYDSAKDNWACSGSTLEEVIGRLEEDSLAHLVRAGLERSGHLAARRP
ncbi:hypothetical protein [Thermaerobacter subterraneus]|uniref:Uncharacterized protein n=1 Tax=Thermaerobacter subterraneus DSM 13965 TaxID=867903 RepID=K6Q3N9_9FIRM|nr:hypothetical protein [Thermaerobacter subterraneus]EKP95704.1 hypothetical protein ThesuDRAFT_01463 [Thermaerobacter subterraneus DSM 13965]